MRKRSNANAIGKNISTNKFMSEMKELEKSAKEAYMKQRVDELGEYINGLFDQLELALRRRAKHGLYFMGSWGTWILAIMCDAAFGGPVLGILHDAAFILYIAVFVAEWIFILPHYFGIISELDGCFKTLEILGMMDKRDDGRRRIKKYKESWMYKFWESLKSKKMQQAFA